MNLVDAVIILIVLIFGALGYKRGVIKSTVQLFGLITVAILSYVFKDFVANFLMGFMPFFDFGGVFAGLTAMNILMYEMLSFVVIFILLYCILSIIISLSGLVEKILKFTVILAIPSKILGFFLGIIEGLVMAFIASFIMLHLPQTERYIMDSKIAIVILERTPFVRDVMLKTTKALEDINEIANEAKNEKNRQSVNADVVQKLIQYGIISAPDVQKLIDDKKIDLKNYQFS